MRVSLCESVLHSEQIGYVCTDLRRAHSISHCWPIITVSETRYMCIDPAIHCAGPLLVAPKCRNFERKICAIYELCLSSGRAARLSLADLSYPTCRKASVHTRCFECVNHSNAHPQTSQDYSGFSKTTRAWRSDLAELLFRPAQDAQQQYQYAALCEKWSKHGWSVETDLIDKLKNLVRCV